MSKKSRSGVGGGSKSGSAAPAVPVVQVPVAKTIPEANALAVSLGLAKQANFSGLGVANANSIIQNLANIKAYFPQLTQLQFIGNSNSFSRTKGYLSRTATAALYSDHDIPIALVFVPKFFRPGFSEKFEKALKASVEMKSAPQGCDTVKAVIDHEIGHYLDKGRVASRFLGGLQVSNDIQIQKLYTSMTRQEIKEKLSNYAGTNIREFIAESWAEYQNNPHPRPTAKAVGDRIKEIYQEK